MRRLVPSARQVKRTRDDRSDFVCIRPFDSLATKHEQPVRQKNIKAITHAHSLPCSRGARPGLLATLLFNSPAGQVYISMPASPPATQKNVRQTEPQINGPTSPNKVARDMPSKSSAGTRKTVCPGPPGGVHGLRRAGSVVAGPRTRSGASAGCAEGEGQWRVRPSYPAAWLGVRFVCTPKDPRHNRLKGLGNRTAG